jgi:hypothetical protein
LAQTGHAAEHHAEDRNLLGPDAAVEITIIPRSHTENVTAAAHEPPTNVRFRG